MIEPVYEVGQEFTTAWWRTDEKRPCTVCGRMTRWIYLDIGHQHPDCDMFPSKEGHVRIISGTVVEVRM